MKKLSIYILLGLFILVTTAEARTGRTGRIGRDWRGSTVNTTTSCTISPLGISADLYAPFDCPTSDTTLTDGQVLDTDAEGVESGSLKVEDPGAGVVEISSGKLQLTGSGTWNTGVISPNGTTRLLGQGALWTWNNSNNISSIVGDFKTANLAIDVSGAVYIIDTNLQYRYDSSSRTIGAVANATDYQALLLFGGSNISKIPFKTGDTSTDFKYGMRLLVKGGAFTDFTLMWVDPNGNTDPVYYGAVPLITYAMTFDNILIPTSVLDVDVMFQPQHLDIFAGTAGQDITAPGYNPYVVSGTSPTGTGSPYNSGSSTWAISTTGSGASNFASGVSELWDASAAVFAGGVTYAWVAYGANNLTNDTGSLKIEYVNHAQGAQIYFADASDLSENLVVGEWYVLSFDAKVGVGDDVRALINNGNWVYMTRITNTAFSTYKMYFQATDTTTNYFGLDDMGAGEIVWLDNLSLQKVTLNERFVSVETGLTQGIFDINITDPGTYGDNGGSGIGLALDSVDTPANFVEIHAQKGANAIGAAVLRVKLWKMVAGTYTNLINTTATYSAGATLRAIVDYAATPSLKIKVYYNGALIGTEQTILDAGIAGNTIHGLMSVDSDNVMTPLVIHNRTNSAWGTEITTATDSKY